MERIDVLSVDGKKTGRIESRETIHSEGLWHGTVHVWIVTSRHDILLQKRAKGKQTHPGLWDMACAGHISSGETSLEAALKEVSEELGIELSPGELTFLFTEKSERIHHQGRYIDREFHDIYLVRKDIPLSSFSLQASEVEALRYMSLHEFSLKVRDKNDCLVPHFNEYARIENHLTSL